MDDDEIIAAYRKYEEEQRRHSPTTVKNRATKLGALARALPCPITQATRDDLEHFLSSRLKSRGGLSDKGRYDWVSMLSAFYKWALVEGHVTENPGLVIVEAGTGGV